MAGETTAAEEYELRRMLHDTPSSQLTEEERIVLDLLTYSANEQEEDIFAVDYTEEYNKVVRPKRTIRLWPFVAAACIAGALFIILTPPKNESNQLKGGRQIAMVEEDSSVYHAVITKDDEPKPLTAMAEQRKQNEAGTGQNKIQRNTENTYKEKQPLIEVRQDDTDVIVDDTEVLDDNLYYASHITDDSLSYQPPSRMEEFIGKIADYNGVKVDSLDCSSEDDSKSACVAYVFEDTDELNLFGRLLQAACWYSDTTPGYLLNYSRKQFFFRLEDRRLGLNYLWIAERINGKILLYGTHSPLNAEVSSDCYREYRDKLMNISINHKYKKI